MMIIYTVILLAADKTIQKVTTAEVLQIVISEKTPGDKINQS